MENVIPKILTNLILLVLSSIPLTAAAQTTWTKHPTPVVSRSAVFPSWKGLATADAFVMQDNDTLKMWYSGSGWLLSTDDCAHLRMGYAWSLDGINWNEYVNNPVLDRGSNPSDFDFDGVETPTVIKDTNAPLGERYKLWYAGRNLTCSSVQDHKIGYAYSPDGINWTKYSGNPVIVPGDSSHWFNTAVYGPSVIYENNSYKMWFTGLDAVANSQSTDGKANIVYATSNDGIAWFIHPSPVLEAGTQNNWDSVVCAEPSVIKVANTYHLFYSALDQWTVEHFQVGYAWSSDGINWTKSAQNPVLTTGIENQWDGYWASHPTTIYDSIDNKFKMWYTGRDTTTIVTLTGYYWDIGYAESDFVLETNELETNNDSIVLYPIPANNKLSINLSFDVSNAEITICNQLGQILTTISDINDRNLTIGTTSLSNGVYFLTLKHNNQLFNKKFIVSK